MQRRLAPVRRTDSVAGASPRYPEDEGPCDGRDGEAPRRPPRRQASHTQEVSTVATIYKELVVEVHAAFAWAAIKDVGGIHERLVKGFVTGTTLEGNVRT